MIPELPELTQLPAVKAAGTAALDKALGYQFRMPPMPGMASVEGMSDSRREAAAKYAADMGAAFYITKQQKKASNKRARAKGRAAQRLAERR